MGGCSSAEAAIASASQHVRAVCFDHLSPHSLHVTYSEMRAGGVGRQCHEGGHMCIPYLNTMSRMIVGAQFWLPPPTNAILIVLPVSDIVYSPNTESERDNPRGAYQDSAPRLRHPERSEGSTHITWLDSSDSPQNDAFGTHGHELSELISPRIQDYELPCHFQP